jgi:prophage regulatory protein
MPNTSQAPAILRLPEVRRRPGRSTSSIYADMQRGAFPRPIKLGAQAVGWLETEIFDWTAARIRERDSVARS